MGFRSAPLDLTLDDPERSKVKVTFFHANYLRNGSTELHKFSRIRGVLGETIGQSQVT